MNDVMARLRSADPARKVDLDTIDEGTWTHLGTQITATDPGSPAAPPARRARFGRRGVVAAGIAAALVGGGVAYAEVSGFIGGDSEGANCVAVWGTQGTMGPWLSGDPIADCAVYLERAGKPAFEDPVAFTVEGLTFVTPADQVPPNAVRLGTSEAVSPAVLELQASSFDFVDGGLAGCRDVGQERAWATSELERLGLSGWRVVVTPGADAPCSTVDASSEERVVRIYPSERPETETFRAGHWSLAADLRTEITKKCLSLAEARAAADAAIARYYDDTWPTTSVVDESASCARVDATIGGNVQVTVYGPTTAKG